MDKTITYPDYRNCILGIPNSILRHYGADTKHPGLEPLSSALDGNYKNVVFIIYDGMGTDMLRGLLSEKSFLRKNITSVITSVFPSTTVAACTTFYSAQPPFEHGWLGWSLYFDKYNKQIDVFTEREAYTGEPSGYENTATTLMPFDSIYSKIEASSKSVKTYSLYPRGIDRPSNPETVLGYDSLGEMHKTIRTLCNSGESKFILAYYNEPDHISHKTGCRSLETKRELKKINRTTKSLCRKLNDTLIIISADHGHIDINKNIYLNEIPELDECLLRPPSIEPRAASIFVKPGTETRFAELFNKLLGKDFLLFSKQKVLDIGLFGQGSVHPLFNGFVGDFMAVAIGDALLRYQIPGGTKPIKFLSHHAGLTAAEMFVPLIIIKS